MRIAIVLTLEEHRTREIMLSKNPDDVESIDRRAHDAARKIVEELGDPELPVDLCCQTEDPSMNFEAYEYLYTINGPLPGEDPEPETAGSRLYGSLADCLDAKAHLKSADDDGFCNYCGHQDNEP